MKKNYFRSLLLGAALLAGAGANAQTYIAGDITAVVTPSMNHDSTQCSSTCMVMCSITIDNSFVGDTVRVVDIGSSMLIYQDVNTGGSTPWMVSFPVPMYGSTVPDNQLMSGGIANFAGPTMKVVCGPDTIHTIINNYTLNVTDPCDYGTVSGMVYIDNNGDCAYNPGDVALNSIGVNSLANLSSPTTPTSTMNTATDILGQYSMSVQKSWMTNYTVSVPSYYTFIFPTTSCFTGSYTYTTLPHTNVDFPLSCTNNIDVQCYAGSPAWARPLIPFYMQPTVSNTGCDSANGQLTLVLDSRVVYNSSLSPNPAHAVHGDTLVWNYANLCNLSGAGYWNSLIGNIHLTPNSTVNIGDTLCFRVYTNILAGDINTANNDYTICLPVVNSYDPNMKEVSPKGTGATGNIPASTPTLTYTIHFQNTGSAVAYNVSIIDTLDSDVTASNLKILSTSHTMTPEWLAPGVVKFNFYSIFLADSNSNEPASHGYVRFSVPMHTGLPIGTQIKNKGYIYFDTNPAIITNTALNTIAAPSAVAGVTPAEVKIYPNPATDNIYVENLQGGNISICNVSGTQVLSLQVATGKSTIDISSLAPGIYIIKTTGNNQNTVTKFIKQ